MASICSLGCATSSPSCPSLTKLTTSATCCPSITQDHGGLIKPGTATQLSASVRQLPSMRIENRAYPEFSINEFQRGYQSHPSVRPLRYFITVEREKAFRRGRRLAPRSAACRKWVIHHHVIETRPRSSSGSNSPSATNRMSNSAASIAGRPRWTDHVERRTC